MIRPVYLDKRDAGFNIDHYGNSFFFTPIPSWAQEWK